MCHPVDTKKWRGWLYFINALMILIGVAVLGISIWALSAKSAAVFRSQYGSLIYAGLGGSICIILLSMCGCGGAFKAESIERRNKRHWCLSIYFVIVSVLFCVQVGILSASIVVHQQLHTLTTIPYNPYDETVLDAEIVDKFLLTHPKAWIEIQDSFECCGWGEFDPTRIQVSAKEEAQLAEVLGPDVQGTGPAKLVGPRPPAVATRSGQLETGAACLGPDPLPCRGVLVTWVQDDLVWVVVFSIIIILTEGMALLATVCICCCAKVEDWDGGRESRSVGKHSPHSDYEKPYSALEDSDVKV